MAKKASAFNKVIGYKGIVSELKQLVDQIKNEDKYKALGARIPHNLLISGEPGLGKTLLSECVIADSGIPAFRVRKSVKNVCEKIQKAFEKAAECEKAIVFLDDMDKFSNVTNWDVIQHRTNTDEFICIQSLIDRYRDSNIFLIATVNDMHVLPPSLVRAGRFDVTIECVTPDFESRVKIIDGFLKKKNCVDNIDARRLAKILDERSVAELETVINQAAIFAAYDGKDIIGEDDFIRAALKVFYHASDDVELKDSEAIRRCAVHQAAHLVVSEILAPGSCNLISISSNSRGTALSVSKEEDYFTNMDYMKNRVTMLLAGKAGVEVVYGLPEVNCGGDLQRAFAITERFVNTYCSTGFDGYAAFPYGSSEYKIEFIESKTVKLIEEYYDDAKRILTENHEFLDATVERLLKDKVLTSFEIEDIKAGLRKGA